jgi:hypothetical protein
MGDGPEDALDCLCFPANGKLSSTGNSSRLKDPAKRTIPAPSEGGNGAFRGFHQTNSALGVAIIMDSMRSSTSR